MDDISDPLNRDACLTALKSARFSLLGNNDHTVAENVFLKYALSLEGLLSTNAEFIYDGHNRLEALKCVHAAAMIKNVTRMDLSTCWPSFAEIYEKDDNLSKTVELIERLHNLVHETYPEYVSALITDEFATYPTIGLAELFFAYPLVTSEGLELTRKSGQTTYEHAEKTFEFYGVVLPSICGPKKVMNFLCAMSYMCLAEVLDLLDKPQPIIYNGYEDLSVTLDHINLVLSQIRESSTVPDNLNMSALIDVGRMTGLVERDGFYLFDALLGLSVNPLERLSQGNDEGNWFGIEFDILREVTLNQVHPTATDVRWFNATADTLAIRGNDNQLNEGTMSLETIVFEKEPQEGLLVSSGSLTDRSLGGIARALHEEWMDMNNVLHDRFPFSSHDLSRITTTLQTFMYLVLGTNMDSLLPLQMTEVYQLYQLNGLSSFFKQAVRCAVFSSITNPRTVKEFFIQDKSSPLQNTLLDKYSAHLLLSISKDFGYNPSKTELLQTVLRVQTESNPSDLSTFMRIVEEEENLDIESVSILDISLDYCRLSPSYSPRASIQVVLQ